jgi:hypothetical protein
MADYQSEDIGDLVVQIGTMTILRKGVMRMLGDEPSPAAGVHLDELVERFSARIDVATLRALELSDQRPA